MSFLTSLMLIIPSVLFAQTRVVLDNYFNHEINSKTGKVFHYTWTDTSINGYSQWGQMFIQCGAKISMLKTAPTNENLSKANIYIIVDPDTPAETPHPNYISDADANVIVNWVKEGGVLVLLANNKGNCEFEHLNHLSENFGIHFNEVSLNDEIGDKWHMAVVTDLPESGFFTGINKIYMKGISSLSLSKSAKAALVKNGNVLMAHSEFGKGFVFAIGDPWIYNEYIGHVRLPEDYQNHKAAENFTGFLLREAKARKKINKSH